MEEMETNHLLLTNLQAYPNHGTKVCDNININLKFYF